VCLNDSRYRTVSAVAVRQLWWAYVYHLSAAAGGSVRSQRPQLWRQLLRGDLARREGSVEDGPDPSRIPSLLGRPAGWTVRRKSYGPDSASRCRETGAYGREL